MIKKFLNTAVILAFLVGASGFNPSTVVAAQMTGVKDTMSTQQTSATAIHTVQWTLPGSSRNTVNDTIAIDFVHTDIVPSGTWQTSDFQFTGNAAGSLVAPAAVGTGAATCSGSSATNYIVNVNAAAGTFTITLCTGWTQSATGFASTFVINGTSASGTGLLTNNASNVSSSVFTITDTGDDTDSATGALAVEDDSVVTITATVAPTLSFTNDDSTIGFGTLTSGAVRYANGAATGSPTRTGANNFAIGTNAAAGYTLTYNGATLTSGANTIPGADINADADGTAGTAQFALAGTETGSGAMVADYDAATPNWDFIPSTTTQIASASAPASSAIAMEYLANIPATQAAGSYATVLTFVTTGNF